MDQEQLGKLAEKIALDAFADNEEFITKELSKSLDWDKGWEKTISRAVVNAVRASAKLSIQITIELLLGTGVFKISEDALRPQLTLVRGGTPTKEDK